jgi:hypothetical protein
MGHDLFFHTVLLLGLLCLGFGMLLYWESIKNLGVIHQSGVE